MGLETATYITDLVSNNPLGTDSKAQGDNHIRLLKSVLKAQFPNLGSAAVTATAADINLLTGGIFDVIYPVGTIYESTSSANPSTHFSGTTWERYGNGRVTVGQDSGDGSFDSVNDTGGAKTVTLTTAQMPSHTHTFSGSTGSNGSHNHTYTYEYARGSGIAGAENGESSTVTGNTSTVGNHTHTFSGTTAIKGSGSAHENMPPYCVVYRWKRTA